MSDLAESARHTSLQLRFWLPLARLFAKPLLAVLGPVRNIGSYRVPRTGPVLILSNHLADIDPVVVQAKCPRPLHFMAKSELFEMPLLGRIQRSFGSFPVVRGTPDRAALKLAAQLLESGELVCLFPEGQLSEGGKLQEIKAGVALIIRMIPGIPVLCCGLTGTNRIIPYGSVIPRPAWGGVKITWGEPRTFEKSSTNEEILAWISGQFRDLTDEPLGKGEMTRAER